MHVKATWPLFQTWLVCSGEVQFGWRWFQFPTSALGLLGLGFCQAKRCRGAAGPIREAFCPQIEKGKTGFFLKTLRDDQEKHVLNLFRLCVEAQSTVYLQEGWVGHGELMGTRNGLVHRKLFLGCWRLVRDWSLLKCYAAREPAWSWGLIVTNAVKNVKHTYWIDIPFTQQAISGFMECIFDTAQESKADNFTIEVEKTKASSSRFGSGWHGVWHKVTSPLTPLTTRPDSVTLYVSRIVLEVSRWQCHCVHCLGQDRLLGISTEAREKRERGHSRIHSLCLSSSWISSVVYWVGWGQQTFQLPFMVCCALQLHPVSTCYFSSLILPLQRNFQVNKYYTRKVHVMMTRSHKIHLYIKNGDIPSATRKPPVDHRKSMVPAWSAASNLEAWPNVEKSHGNSNGF